MSWHWYLQMTVHILVSIEMQSRRYGFISIVGLVVEYTVAIGVTRVRFPDDAFFVLLFQTNRRQTKVQRARLFHRKRCIMTRSTKKLQVPLVRRLARKQQTCQSWVQLSALQVCLWMCLLVRGMMLCTRGASGRSVINFYEQHQFLFLFRF